MPVKSHTKSYVDVWSICIKLLPKNNVLLYSTVLTVWYIDVEYCMLHPQYCKVLLNFTIMLHPQYCTVLLYFSITLHPQPSHVILLCMT